MAVHWVGPLFLCVSEGREGWPHTKIQLYLLNLLFLVNQRPCIQFIQLSLLSENSTSEEKVRWHAWHLCVRLKNMVTTCLRSFALSQMSGTVGGHHPFFALASERHDVSQSSHSWSVRTAVKCHQLAPLKIVSGLFWRKKNLCDSILFLFKRRVSFNSKTCLVAPFWSLAPKPRWSEGHHTGADGACVDGVKTRPCYP